MSDMMFKMFLIVLAINGALLLGNAAILDTNADAGIFFSCQDSALMKYEQSGCTSGSYILNTTNSINDLPTDVNKVSEETGNIFTDLFSTFKNWFLQATGLHYIINLVGAPYLFLQALQLPALFAFVVGTIWYGFSISVIIGFLRGI